MRVRSKAPLRLGLGGGGTDVSPYSDRYGGQVLNATIDQYAYCTLEPESHGHLAIDAPDVPASYSEPAAARVAIDGPLRLHLGVYNRIVQQFHGGRPLPVRITTYSDVSAGSGLGTSSTMVVAMLQAFNEYLRLGLGEYDIASLAYAIEREDVGLSGGKQDQYAAAFGGFNFMEFAAGNRVIVNPLRVKDWIVSELEVSLVLFHTGRSRDSARIIDEQVANTEAPASASVEAMHQLREDATRMKEALLTGDLKQFAAVLGHSWESKKRLAHSVSNPEIEQVFAAALGAGAHSGKVSGAGGGGVAMFMVDPRRRIKVVEALSACGGRVIPFHFTQRGAEAWRPERGLNGAPA